MRPKQTLVNSFRIAFSGLFHGLLKERNSKIQLTVAAVTLTVSIILGVSKLEMLVIVTACFFVIILELINTSIEKLLDVLYPNHHPEIGLVKDIMSGVVLLGALLSVVIGVIVLYQPAIEFIQRVLK